MSSNVESEIMKIMFTPMSLSFGQILDKLETKLGQKQKNSDIKTILSKLVDEKQIKFNNGLYSRLTNTSLSTEEDVVVKKNENKYVADGIVKAYIFSFIFTATKCTFQDIQHDLIKQFEMNIEVETIIDMLNDLELTNMIYFSDNYYYPYDYDINVAKQESDDN